MRCRIPIKPHFFYPRLCQFLMKIITQTVMHDACIRTSAEDNNIPREGNGCVYLLSLFNWRVFVFVCQI